jgi:hypothetical protein
MNKLNCWEFMKCGKGIGENETDKSEPCPVALKISADGLNGGINAGRICWIIAEGKCHSKVRCNKIHQKEACFSCEFRYKVMAEEGLLNVCNATGTFLATDLSQ